MSNQLRQHLQFGWANHLRLFRERLRLGHCGDQVYFDKNVELMRFPQNIHIDSHAVVKEGARICACNKRAQISIGKNTTVGYHTFVFASELIAIGNDCLIAPFVYLVDSDHGVERERPINTQPNETAPIVIEDDVWIGTSAKILKGVRIGRGAVIAAGSVVKDDVEPYSIVGGIPARAIGERPCAQD